MIKPIRVDEIVVNGGEAVEHLLSHFNVAQARLILARGVLGLVADELVFFWNEVGDVFDVVWIT